MSLPGAEDVDPNTLWPSAYESPTYSVDPEIEQEMLVEGTNRDVDMSLLGVKRNMREFWAKHESDFRRFWTRMRPDSRENFIRDVYPLMVQSLSDRYCVLNGAKIYEHRYDYYLLLAPWMTVEYLIHEDNLPKLIEEWTTDNALSVNANSMVVQFRQLVDAGVYPLSRKQREEYARQRNPQVGDTCIMLYGGRLTRSAEETFGSYMTINKPHEVLNGTGTPSPNGGTMNMYALGRTGNDSIHWLH